MTKRNTRINLPASPSVVATARGAIWLSEDGEVELLGRDALSNRLTDDVIPYVCHAKATARRLK